MDNKNKQYCPIGAYGYDNTLLGAYICYGNLKIDYPDVEFIVIYNKEMGGFCVVGLTDKTIYA